MALLRGRRHVLPSDIKELAPEVLRHRLLLSYEALAAGVTTDDVIDTVLDAIEPPRVAPAQDLAEDDDDGLHLEVLG